MFYGIPLLPTPHTLICLSRLGPVSIKNRLSNAGTGVSPKTRNQDHPEYQRHFLPRCPSSPRTPSLEIRLGDLILRFGKILLYNPAQRDILPPEAPTVSRTKLIEIH